MKPYPALLLFAACSHRVEQKPDSTADTVVVASPSEGKSDQVRASSVAIAAMPLPRNDTVAWADTTKRGDTTFYSRGRVITSTVVLTDSQWVKLPPVLGIPFGTMQIPPDTLCKWGYTGGMVPLRDSAQILSDLAKVRSCKGRVIVNAQQPKFRDSTGLKVSLARAELDKWPWVKLCNRVKDSTVIGLHLGDDVTHDQWGKNVPLTVRVARWDSIMGYARAKCPEAARVIRARPSQLQKYQWSNLTTLWLQYTGPKRHGRPEDIVASEVKVAKQMKVGMVIGLNLLKGGCGPTSDCIKDASGQVIKGAGPADRDGLYKMTAAEVTQYGNVIASEPYNCAFVSWAWGFGSDFFSYPANRAALSALGVLAKGHPSTSCIQR